MIRSRYRDDAEVSRQWPAEPIARLRNYLVKIGHWDKGKEEMLLLECSQSVEAAANEYLSMPPQLLTAAFDYTYAQMPTDLSLQRDMARLPLSMVAHG